MVAVTVLGLLVAATVRTPPASAVTAPDGDRSPLTIESAPRWGQVREGAWAPYVVTLRNEGLVDVEGEVVLAPVPQARRTDAEPGQAAVPVGFAVPRGMDSSELVASADTGWTTELAGGAELGRGVWPTHRVPVALPAGGEKTLSLLVAEAPLGYRAELRDQAGTTVAVEVEAADDSTSTVQRSEGAVAVLGRTGTSDILDRGATGRPLISDLQITAFDTARDFPDDALHLSGLGVVVLANFDSGSFTEAQLRALRDFVELGGSLVLGGGPTWQRTLDAVPEDLVPLRPAGTATATLAPLAGDGPAASAVATVAIGETRFGTAVTAADGLPLVVTAPFGSGLIVQLTYDPFAEPFDSDPELGAIGLEAGLSPALNWLRGGSGGAPSPQVIWQPALNAPDRPVNVAWPPWPRWGLVLLGAYVLALGPMVYLVVRSRRRGRAWAAIPASAFGVAAVMGLANPAGIDAPLFADNVVEVHLLGVDGTELVHGYHELTELRGGKHARDDVQQEPAVESPPGTAVSSILPVPEPGAADGTVPTPGDLQPAPAAPSVAMAEDGSSYLRPGEGGAGGVQPMQSLAISRDQGTLTASLALSGTFALQDRRVSGTVTNGTSSRLSSLVIQSSGRTEARVNEVIEPGASIRFDAPLATLEEGALAARPREERAMSAAGRFFFERPPNGRVVMTALVDSADAGDPDLRGTKLEILVKLLVVPE